MADELKKAKEEIWGKLGIERPELVPEIFRMIERKMNTPMGPGEPVATRFWKARELLARAREPKTWAERHGGDDG